MSHDFQRVLFICGFAPHSWRLDSDRCSLRLQRARRSSWTQTPSITAVPVQFIDRKSPRGLTPWGQRTLHLTNDDPARTLLVSLRWCDAPKLRTPNRSQLQPATWRVGNPCGRRWRTNVYIYICCCVLIWEYLNRFWTRDLTRQRNPPPPCSS